jgi:membrane dipeptidase
MPIVDLHLDLAWNVARGRDVRSAATQQPRVDNETATVGLPDLTAGDVTLAGATLFALPAGPAPHEGYTCPAQAADQADRQLDTYLDWETQRKVRLVRTGADLDGPELGLVVLMEGADALDTAGPRDARHWFDRGVRIVGLAWRGTRHAGGTGEPGGLTDSGQDAVKALDAVGMIHDVSHLAERAVDELLGEAVGPVLASHSNCRAIIGDDPDERHLTDQHLRAVAARDGVIGLNLFDRFLLPPADLKRRRTTLADWVAHVRHACDVIGDDRHVALGSDLDGGFGRERIPIELRTAGDLPRLGDALGDAGFDDVAIARILFRNARLLMGKTLPSN